MATTAFADWVMPVSVVILVALFSVQSTRHRRHRQGLRAGDGGVVRRDRRPRAAPDHRPSRCARGGVAGLRGRVLRRRAGQGVPRPSGRSSSSSPAARRCTPTWATSAGARSSCRGTRWVFPALLLNYFGQAALLSRTRTAIESPFYRLAPDWAITPLAILATMATVIASQALISGAFSMTAQAIQLDYIPRLDGAPHVGRARRADLRAARQLAADARLRRARARLPLVERPRLGLRHRRHGDDGDHDAAVLQGRRNRASAGRRAKAVLVLMPLLAVDLAFFAANVPKIPDGGWFPLLVALVLVIQMTTWRRGRDLVAARLRRAEVPMTDDDGQPRPRRHTCARDRRLPVQGRRGDAAGAARQPQASHGAPRERPAARHRSERGGLRRRVAAGRRLRARRPECSRSSSATGSWRSRTCVAAIATVEVAGEPVDPDGGHVLPRRRDGRRHRYRGHASRGASTSSCSSTAAPTAPPGSSTSPPTASSPSAPTSRSESYAVVGGAARRPKRSTLPSPRRAPSTCFPRDTKPS